MKHKVALAGCSGALDSCPTAGAEMDFVIEALANLDILGAVVQWNDPNIAWESYSAVVICQTWDYTDTDNIELFTNWLKDVSTKSKLLNSINILTWNIEKCYLRELQDHGLPIVPTVFLEYKDRDVDNKHKDMLQQIDHWGDYIIKPGIGCDSENISRFNSIDNDAMMHIYKIFDLDRNVLIQPYVESIKTHGETSLIYINQCFSHCVLKSPSTSDYRVQEKYGGCQKAIPVTQKMLDMGQLVVEKLSQIFPQEQFLYMRIDLLLSNDTLCKTHNIPIGSYLIGEIELVEPALYFYEDRKMNPCSNAPTLYAEAIQSFVCEGNQCKV